MLTLTSLGGAGTVTGSKHLLSDGAKRILVDGGLFQGLKNLRELNWAPLPVPPSSINAVVLTHAHLDHSGYLPKLVRDGFRGRIYATGATRDMAELILKDSAHLNEKDAEYANRKGFSKHKPALPLYDMRDAERALGFFTPVPFDKPTTLPSGATLTFRHAGHILGAAIAEISWGGRRIIASGDLGRYDDPVLPDPTSVDEADIVLVESTYGNRTHDTTDPTEALSTVIERTVGRGGTIIIPAFAVGRAQSLLYHLWKLKTAGRLAKVPVYLDSPMAIDATDLLHAHHTDHRLTPEECTAICAVATCTRDVEASKAINFGIIYGISAFGLARQLAIPPNEARSYIDAYFARYPGIRAYMERTKEEARINGFVLTPFGRRCWVPGIADKNPARRGYAERQAINAPLQGGAADIIKRAMVLLPGALAAAGVKARMLLQVHDELLFEVPEGEADATAAVAKRVMEGVASLSVPLVVETGTGGVGGRRIERWISDTPDGSDCAIVGRSSYPFGEEIRLFGFLR